MTKRANEAKRVASLPPKPAAVRTPFTPEECIEIKEMQRLVNSRKFEAAQIKGNTALVPRGQQVAEEIEAIARLVENAKNLFISQKLLDHGYPHDSKCDINLNTGEVIVQGEAAPEAPKEEKPHDVGPKNSTAPAKRRPRNR